MASVDRCENDRQAALRRARAPRKTGRDRWAEHLWRRYKLTPDQVAEMWAMQEGRCGVCGCDMAEKNWVVDHNHKTGIVRGLLCFFCNWKVLGMVERAGKVRTLRAAVYLGWATIEHVDPVGSLVTAAL